MPEIEKTEAEWRDLLSPEQYSVLRQAGTERPWSGALVHNHDDGTYACAACGAELFDSSTKFESGSGWPSFYEPKIADAVELDRGPRPRHGAGRGPLPPVRLAPRSRLPRRPAADGHALLHELPLAGLRPEALTISALTIWAASVPPLPVP